MTRDDLIAAGLLTPAGPLPRLPHDGPMLTLDDRGRAVAAWRILHPFDRRELTEDFSAWFAAPKRRKRRREGRRR